MAASHHCHCGFESRVVDVFDPIRTNKGTRPGFVWQTLLRSADDPMMNFREGLTRGLAQLRAFHGMRVETGARSGTAGCQTRYGRTTSPPVLRFASAQEVAGAVGAEAGLLADAFEGHGFQLSFGSRKTAATLSFRGPGAPGIFGPVEIGLRGWSMATPRGSRSPHFRQHRDVYLPGNP